MAFEGLHRDVFDVIDTFAQELLGGCRDGDVVSLNLNLGHAIDPHRHAFAGIDFRRVNIDGQQLQRKNVHFFNDWNDEGAAAFDYAEATILQRAIGIGDAMFAARNDEHLVRADLGITAGPDRQENNNDDNNADGAQGDSSPTAEDGLGEKNRMVHRLGFFWVVQVGET